MNYDKAQGTYLYEAYDDYYLGAPKVKQLKFVKVSSEMSASALENGDVDAAERASRDGGEPEGVKDLWS